MKMCKCRKFVIARVMVSDRDGKLYTLTMFDNIISKIVDGIDGMDVGKSCCMHLLVISTSIKVIWCTLFRKFDIYDGTWLAVIIIYVHVRSSSSGANSCIL